MREDFFDMERGPFRALGLGLPTDGLARGRGALDLAGLWGGEDAASWGGWEFVS
jgi:hypothetical protein